MIASALLVLAQEAFVERQLGSVLCRQPSRSLRERCVLEWRRSRGCGC